MAGLVTANTLVTNHVTYMAKQTPHERYLTWRRGWWASQSPEQKKAIHDKKRKSNDEKNEVIKKAKSQPCADCGVEYPWYVMDFDHVRGEKLFNVSSSAYSKGLDTILEEIEKCEIVCSNCHRVRTASRGGWA